MIKPLVPTLAFALFTLASTLDAGVIVTTQANAPDENVFLTVVPTANTLVTQWRNDRADGSTRRDVGQTFFVSEDRLLKSITFKVSSVGTVNGDGASGAEFTLSIYHFANQTSYTPSGPALYTGSSTLPATISSGSFMTFTLEDPVLLGRDHYYGIVLSFPDWASQRRVNFYSGGRSLAGDDYGVPLYYQYSEGTYVWQEGGNALQMYAAAVPEPGMATLIFMTVPFLMAGIVLQRRIRN